VFDLCLRDMESRTVRCLPAMVVVVKIAVALKRSSDKERIGRPLMGTKGHWSQFALRAESIVAKCWRSGRD
jgi:hypothetical protein